MTKQYLARFENNIYTEITLAYFKEDGEIYKSYADTRLAGDDRKEPVDKIPSSIAGYTEIDLPNEQ